MLEKIKQRIADTEDRQKAFKLLMYADAPMLILRILGGSEAVSGDVWVKDGKRIVGVFTTPTGDTGLLGLYELLELKEARFEVMEAIIAPQGEAMDLSIEELVEDEQKLMNWIADKVGIQRTAHDDLAKQDSGDGQKADGEKEESAQTEAPAAVAEQKDNDETKETADHKDNDKTKEVAEHKDDDKTEETAEQKDGDQSNELAERKESDQKSKQLSAESVAQTAVDESAVQATSDTKIGTDQPRSKSDKKSGKKKGAKQNSEEKTNSEQKPKAESANTTPAAMSPESEQRLQDVLNIKGADEEAVSQDIEIAMEPEMEERLQKVLNFKPHELLGLDAGNLKEVLGMGPNSGTTTTTESTGAVSEAQLAFAASSGGPSLLHDDSRLDHKKRADMEALALLTGENTEDFYKKAQDLDVVVDDLADQRVAEVNAIGAIMRESGDAFYEKTAIPPEDDRELAEKRRTEYQAVNELLGEKKESFYEKPVGELADAPADGLGELQKKVLSIMETESSDPATFEAKDPTMLLNDGSLMPKWTVEESAKVEIPPEAPPVAAEDHYAVPVVAPSPYAEKTSALTNKEKMGNQLSLGPNEDDMSLLLRGKDEDHKIVAANIARMKPTPISRRTIVAAAIAALAIPMFAIGMMRYQSGVAQADDEDRRSASTLVKSSVEKESLANKPSEGYRAAAAGAPSGSGSGKPYYSPDSVSVDGSGPVDQNMKYVPSKSPLPQPDGNQLAQDERVISQGNDLVSHGHAAQAIGILGTALVRSPGNVQLRIATARAYIALRDYRNAKIVCMAGMHDAANAGDFANLYNLLKSIP